ncbi:hypothetical protein LKW57_002142 [Salmonella enterica]|nr:hypothetical protein [Salmonella enterica]
MPQLKHKTYFHIQFALSCECFDAFTVKSLRDKLLQQSDEAKSCVDDRKAIYRTLIAMVKRGELCKKVATNPRDSTFHKTPKFTPVSSPDLLGTADVPDTVSATHLHIERGQGSVKYLESQLKEYQISLLVSIGESEEYKTLFAALPTMSTELEDLYIKAREKSSTLLGKITAINNVLSHCKSTVSI